jgi:peptide/nickel transport system permease protein
MLRYLAGRFAQALLVLWAAYTVTFAVLYLLPGDPIGIMLAAADVQVEALSPEELERVKALYGLDQPMSVHYLHSLLAALHGDFGLSLTKSEPVTTMILDRLPGTMSLAGCSVALSLVFGVALAYLGVYVRWRPARLVLSRLPAFGVSFPSFWVGLILIQVFAFGLGWVPASGEAGPRSLVLPVITMSIPSAAVFAQVLMKSLDTELRQPYAVAARSRGLSRAQVQARYASRYAALPLLTLLGLQIANTVSGAIVIETVFTRVGIGRLAQEAVLSQDIPLVLGIVVLGAAAFVVVNLLVDLLYPLVDPRTLHISGRV